MWGVNAAAPLNAVQSGYGIGAVLVNLLVRPFLNEKVLSTSVNENEGIHSTKLSMNTTWADSNIVIPYSITAVLCVLIAVGHTYFYVRKLRNQKQKLEIRQVRRY
jgi:FHS family Na+ dependent glucose MFS transporter 1